MHPTTTGHNHDGSHPAGQLRAGSVIGAVAAVCVTGPAWAVTGSLAATAAIAAATLAAVTVAALMI